MKTSASLLLMFGLALSLVLTNCKPAGEKKQTDVATEDAPSFDKTKVQSEVRDVVKQLPTPFELAQLLNEAGAEFNAQTLNNPDNIKNTLPNAARP
ncbi:MAG: hypothetical protein HC896_02865 [Bacteroidales bacterium]|nr:hypothetical protein [Bacteroidales bacterium]